METTTTETAFEVIQDGTRATHSSRESLVSAMVEAGRPVTGINSGRGQREILAGQPRFKGVNGPMYGGAGLVRYEVRS